jgi:hypothetical protein
MSTINPYDLHDHSGLRWLLPFGAVFILVISAAFMMMLYPHVLR